ncbi:MAG: hypothetical protein JSS75_12840 [Bacteroidetes bacterium]|nr:hypothetical protein [Bacteroidota bacterium]
MQFAQIRHIIIVTALLLTAAVVARSQTNDCEPCKRPGAMASFSDSTMDVQFSDGTLLRGVRSANRTIMSVGGLDRQAIRLTYLEGGRCHDTTVDAAFVSSFLHEGIGGTHDPLRYPVLPAREVFNHTLTKDERSFVEFTGLVGYGGSDTSGRKIGFTSTYFALEAIFAPLGDALGDHFTAAVGGGALFEGGRTRFPLYLQLRYDLFAHGQYQTINTFLPDSCAFRTPLGLTAAVASDGYEARPTGSAEDSSVILQEDHVLIRPSFRPFAYIEGGTLFDSKFTGSGTPDNVVNPEARKPILLGAGIGVPIADILILTLGYRYMQLHLATPCEECVDRSVINRNTVHSITLKGAYRLSW